MVKVTTETIEITPAVPAVTEERIVAEFSKDELAFICGVIGYLPLPQPYHATYCALSNALGGAFVTTQLPEFKHGVEEIKKRVALG